jgi:hypothetical protein
MAKCIGETAIEYDGSQSMSSTALKRLDVKQIAFFFRFWP